MPTADSYDKKLTGSKGSKKLSGVNNKSGTPAPGARGKNIKTKATGVSTRGAIGKADAKTPSKSQSKVNSGIKPGTTIRGAMAKDDAKVAKNSTKPFISNASSNLADFRQGEHYVPPYIPNAAEHLRDFRLGEPGKKKTSGETTTTTVGNVDDKDDKATIIKSIPEVPKGNGGGSGGSGGGNGNSGSSSSSGAAIKIATSNLFILNEPELEIEQMANMIIQEIGGIELITISRNTLISEQEINYQPIKNIADTSLQYNPLNILAIQDVDSEYFDKFPINLDKYIPNVGNGTGGAYVYINSNNEVVVESVNLQPGQSIEIQFLSFGSTISGTIYT